MRNLLAALAIIVVALAGLLIRWLLGPDVNRQMHRDREAARKWARDLLSRTDWVILDTATAALAASSEVIQIGVVAPDGSVLMDQLCKPMGRIDPRASLLHGLTNNDLLTAPPYTEVHPTLKDLVRGKKVVVFDASFDALALQQTARRHGTDALEVTWDCCMIQFSSFVWEPDPSGGYIYQKLPRSDQHADLHGAIGDCRRTLHVIKLMAR